MSSSSAIMTLCAAYGHELAAYRAEPTGAPVGGLVVLQEIFGVNQHIREVADANGQRERTALGAPPSQILTTALSAGRRRD
jgi:dienelactone hydrolase